VPDRHAQGVLPFIDDIRSVGVTGLRGIAAELNARGIITARSGEWPDDSPQPAG
jgi:hypothetical protein